MSAPMPIAALLETPVPQKNLKDPQTSEEPAHPDAALFETLMQEPPPLAEGDADTIAPPPPEPETPEVEGEAEAAQPPAPDGESVEIAPESPEIAAPPTPPASADAKTLPDQAPARQAVQTSAEQFTLLSQSPPPPAPRTDGAAPASSPVAALDKGRIFAQATPSSLGTTQAATALQQAEVVHPSGPNEQVMQPAPPPAPLQTDVAQTAEPKLADGAKVAGLQPSAPTPVAAPLNTPPTTPPVGQMAIPENPVRQDTTPVRVTPDTAPVAASATPPTTPLATAAPVAALAPTADRSLRTAASDREHMASERRLTQTAAPPPPVQSLSTAQSGSQTGAWVSTPTPVAAMNMVAQKLEAQEKSSAQQQGVFSDVWGTAAAPDAPSTLRIPALHSPAMIQHVARQLAEALPTQLNNQVSLSLNPDELGRVRMALLPGDGAITVNILAERPETLDLLRRNIGDLAREFQEMGFENITFSFDQSAAQNDGDAQGDDSTPQTANAGLHLALDEPSADMPAPPQRLAVSTGLDIRL